MALIDLDIAQLVDAETERHRINALLHDLVISSVDAVVAAGHTGRIFIFNPVAAKLTGYTVEAALDGLYRCQLFPEGEDARILDCLRGSEDGGPGKLQRYRTTLHTREGTEVPVRLNAAMVHENGQEVASIGFFRDLRTELQTQRDLEQTQLQLLQAEKMSTLGELAPGWPTSSTTRWAASPCTPG